MSISTNNRLLSVVTLLLLTANIVTLALLWTNKKQENMPPGPNAQQGAEVFEFITNELKLDSTQQEVYKKLRTEHQSSVRPLQDSIRKAKDNFFALLQKENVDDSTIQEYSTITSRLEQQRDVFTLKHFQKLRAICNKEQQTKFDNIIQQVIRQMGGPKGPPSGPPPGMEHGDRRPPPPPQ